MTNSMAGLTRALGVVALVFTAGCVAPLDGQFSCPAPARSCPPDFFCHSDGVCRATPEAMLDAGSADAARDAFTGDGGPPDATEFDAPLNDGPLVDAPMIDAPACDPASCETADTCTTASCATGSCVLVPNTDPCADLLFCNGAEVCRGGTCTSTPPPVCPTMGMVCSEGLRRCATCGELGGRCCAAPPECGAGFTCQTLAGFEPTCLP